MTYDIFICDDEPQMLNSLSANVKNILGDSRISAFSGGSSLLKALERGECRCDILLLDIDMPEIGGLDIAKRLSGLERRPLLVFVTSHDELVYDSLQFHPFGFVRKSHIDAELPKLLGDCVQELGSRERHFCFHAAGADVKLPLGEILYFEAEGNYLKLFAGEEYRFRETLSAVEAALSGSGFVRIHKGYLVNQAAVRALGTDEALLTNGARLPIGRSYAEAAKKQLMRYMVK